MTTEQELLEMSNHFRDLMKKKNNKIIKMQKHFCVMYGLIRTMCEYEDMSFLELLRTEASKSLTEYCGIEEYEDDESS